MFGVVVFCKDVEIAVNDFLDVLVKSSSEETEKQLFYAVIKSDYRKVEELVKHCNGTYRDE